MISDASARGFFSDESGVNTISGRSEESTAAYAPADDSSAVAEVVESTWSSSAVMPAR